MNTPVLAVIAIIVVLLVLLIGFGPVVVRRRRLRQRFGPEYDRVVAERSSRRQAEAELTERERRVAELKLRDLTEAEQDKYQTRWAELQEAFVDSPPEAIADAQLLVESVIRDRGYPVAEYDQTLADLSVRHSRALRQYRSAHDISVQAVSGQVSTEELRVAMLGYRRLFDELTGAAPAQATPAQATPAQAARAQEHAPALRR
jgi:hypothetical protein